MREIAEQIGWAPKRLRNYLHNREREAGVRILVPRGDATKRPIYFVDGAALRRSCPELFDARDPVAHAIGSWREEVQRELRQQRESIDDVCANIDLLTESMRQLIAQMRAQTQARPIANARRAG